jgi:hypothetical protein
MQQGTGGAMGGSYDNTGYSNTGTGTGMGTGTGTGTGGSTMENIKSHIPGTQVHLLVPTLLVHTCSACSVAKIGILRMCQKPGC